jgi:DNA modification methylase
VDKIEFGDCRETMRRWKEQGVKAQTCVTSPPYYGLRDYGHEGQIGLEETPEAYIKAMVEVFRCVWDVLADDGTLWLNIGDSYAGSGRGGNPEAGKQATNRGSQSVGVLYGTGKTARDAAVTNVTRRTFESDGIKAKDLIGIPWMLAFALRADGWYLRQDIIWHKPNPMPESVQDRCTKAHEYIFLLSKSQKYYFDNEAIAEPLASASIARLSQANLENQKGSDRVPGKTNGNMKAVGPRFGGDKYGNDDSEKSRTKSGNEWAGNETGRRNKRSVWTVTTKPYKGAHFATFPTDLITPCILAGSRPAGKRCDCDETIGTPTGTGGINDPSMDVGRAGMARPRRIGEGTRPITRLEQRHHATEIKASAHKGEMSVICGPAFGHYIRTDLSGARPLPEALRLDFLQRGWITNAPACNCPLKLADIVLDPFMGSGTTAAVAIANGRDYLGCELNPAYKELQDARIGAPKPTDLFGKPV